MVEMGESSASAKPSDEIWAKLGNPFFLISIMGIHIHTHTLQLSIQVPNLLGFRLNRSILN
jgi:hypothetical protein